MAAPDTQDSLAAIWRQATKAAPQTRQPFQLPGDWQINGNLHALGDPSSLSKAKANPQGLIRALSGHGGALSQATTDPRRHLEALGNSDTPSQATADPCTGNHGALSCLQAGQATTDPRRHPSALS